MRWKHQVGLRCSACRLESTPTLQHVRSTHLLHPIVDPSERFAKDHGYVAQHIEILHCQRENRAGRLVEAAIVRPGVAVVGGSVTGT